MDVAKILTSVTKLQSDPVGLQRMVMEQIVAKQPRLRVLDMTDPVHAGWAPTLAMLMSIDEQILGALKLRGPIPVPDGKVTRVDNMTEAREHVNAAIMHIFAALGVQQS